jgi:hypothetical protein
MKSLENALEYLTGHRDVGVPTTDEIADWYYAHADQAPGS